MAKRKKTPPELEAASEDAQGGSENRALIFTDGSRLEITGEEGKFFLCGGVRFRKGNPRIARVQMPAARETETGKVCQETRGGEFDDADE